MNMAVDDSINYEINTEAITLAPIFKGKKTAKEDFDPEAEENQVKPGVTWWLTEPDAFGPINIGQKDTSQSAMRRQEIIRYSEMEIGPTQLLSGRESPTDPNAPGNKTIALIQQSNMRIEDYIKEFKNGFDQVGDLVFSLYYQFGPGILEFDRRDAKDGAGSLKREDLKKRPKMHMRGVTANLNPEAEMAKAMQWYAVLSKEPMVGGDPVRRRALLNELMLAGRLANRDELLPEKAEVRSEQEKQMMAEAEKKVVANLIKRGIIPPPPVPTGPPPNGDGPFAAELETAVV
jgi:hypothetical protein